MCAETNHHRTTLDACRNRKEEALTAQGGASAKRIAEGNRRYEKHLNKRRQVETQKRESEPKKRPASEEEDDNGNQNAKQPKREERPGKRALEEEGNEEENPAKCRQLEEEPSQDEEAQEHSDAEMAIEGVRDQGNTQYWDDLSGKPLILEFVEKARLE